ncbi:MAG: nitrite reductase [Geobacteraceae bacterium GWC2_55_20]|nr:MAG: nitrite reductase [Geobacteraceae bacterium GWC2_55_20]OGU22072.1 MAG: nitrite reductase [Geobacteraceae bacterium GWF2_54_21]HCE66436.1 nitrite reductase [Geobacter sp.]
MTTRISEYRLDGIYRQRQDGFFMQRVKLAAGVISAGQTRAVALAATRFGQGAIHLTSRGSMEIHWLKEADLPELKNFLATVGLTSRGACGGAVRGVTCSSQGAAGFPALESMARRLHRHFTANPRFERLPKKFKIGIEADTVSRRHLIQDVGLVLAASEPSATSYDLYLAGGLGREPQPGFLFEAGVVENRIIPLIEAIARVYAAHTPAGKRLKHLIREIGEHEFRRLVALEPTATEELPQVTGLPEHLVRCSETTRIVAQVPAGELTGEQLTRLAGFADRFGGGVLMVTVDQDIAFHVSTAVDPAEAESTLKLAGFGEARVTFRVCPGSHQCLVGLTPTRDVAATVINVMGPLARSLRWAISGCPNSCTQPQLADFGIVSSSLVKDDQGRRTPCFDLYRLGNKGLGSIVDHSLTLDELCDRVREIG